jgi:tetratricopeptide (TPR) repeat protein/DNA-binding XRE family transcriptional regulator
MATPNQKLAEARLRKRWSIAVASEKAGVSINTFHRWERGLQIPQLGTLDQVCKAFDLSPEELGFEQICVHRKRVKDQFSQRDAVLPVSLPMWEPDRNNVGSLYLDKAAAHDFYIPTSREDKLFAYFELTQRSLDSMNMARNRQTSGEGVSRRQALVALIGTPAVVLSLTQDTDSANLHPEETLSLCACTIPLSWQLYFEGGLPEVEKLLQGYLSRLTGLAQQSSPYQTRAAGLASQAYQLASLVALQHQNFGHALTHAQQAFTFAKLAGDTNLQTASYIRQSQVYLYLNRPLNRLQAYEKALYYAPHSSPLLQGRVYVGLTETHGQLGNQKEAAHYLDLARETFPMTHFDADPAYAYTHFNHWSFAALEGLMHLHLKQPQAAWETLSREDIAVPHALIPNRVELTVRQARVAYTLNERDLACSFIESAAMMARHMGNQLRFDETYAIHEDMLKKWPGDPKVSMLADIFH